MISIRPLPKVRMAIYAAAFASMAAGVTWISIQVDDAKTRVFEGVPRIADGDSLTIDGQRIRLVGIDAPELDQSCSVSGEKLDCGRQARDFLRSTVGRRPVRCAGRAFDKYARLLAVCDLDGQNLNQLMVTNGWAVSYGRFVSEEAEARSAKRGVWNGRFEPPQSWRAQRRGDAAWWNIFGWFK